MEKEIDLTKLKERLPMLEAKWKERDDANLEYNAAIDAVANDTGADKGVLKKLVAAIKREKSEAEKAAAEELSDLIDAVGC